jgi:hypothetical protein
MAECKPRLGRVVLVHIDTAKTSITLKPGKDLLVELLTAYASANRAVASELDIPPSSMATITAVDATRLKVATRTAAWSDNVAALACHILLGSTASTLAHAYKSIPSSKHNPLVLQCLYQRLIIIVGQFGQFGVAGASSKVTSAPSEITNSPSEITNSPSEIADVPSEIAGAPSEMEDPPSEIEAP